jgi:hypothetical protein
MTSKPLKRPPGERDMAGIIWLILNEIWKTVSHKDRDAPRRLRSDSHARLARSRRSSIRSSSGSCRKAIACPSIRGGQVGARSQRPTFLQPSDDASRRIGCLSRIMSTTVSWNSFTMWTRLLRSVGASALCKKQGTPSAKATSASSTRAGIRWPILVQVVLSGHLTWHLWGSAH